MTQQRAAQFDPAGPAAEAIDRLWWLLLGLGVAVFVVFAVLLAFGLWRRRPEGDDGPPEEPDGDRLVRRWIVAGGAVMPTIVLLVVLVATVAAMRAMPAGRDDGDLVVEIVGHQFWYEVRYPEQGVSARNELHIPVGRRVVLELGSGDVIHSFWVPDLGGKTDMLPDGTNTMVLEADEPGVYRAQCAEFCGVHHAHMELRVVAEPPGDFAAWLAAQR